jgi:hypothetical protein
VTGVPEERVSRLKETLGTRDEMRARMPVKLIMMRFDRV